MSLYDETNITFTEYFKFMHLREDKMNIKYFQDSDTTFIELSEWGVSETIEITENIYADLDSEGRVVSLTIEHASEAADMPAFAFQLIQKSA
jgi:uncharacterized protein YuzE